MKKDRLKKRNRINLVKFKVARLDKLGSIYGGNDGGTNQTIENTKDSTLPCFLTLTQPTRP